MLRPRYTLDNITFLLGIDEGFVDLFFNSVLLLRL